MAFYDLPKTEREARVREIKDGLIEDLENKTLNQLSTLFADEDTYIRKSAYISLGRLYWENPHLQSGIIGSLKGLFSHTDFKVRQTVINAAGEIGKKDFEVVRWFFESGLFDPHHSPRNAVIGSIKKMGEVNPEPVLDWARGYLKHPDKEIRREICHGIELRGRKHPQDILHLLRELEWDKTARVRNTVIHVIGQIAYKKGCLETVVNDLKNWENKSLVAAAREEIIDVHHRYRNFSYYTQEEAIEMLKNSDLLS